MELQSKWYGHNIDTALSVGVLVDKKLDMTQECPCSPESQSCPGLQPKHCGLQAKGRDSALRRPHLQFCIQHKKDMDVLERGQREPHR